VRERCKIRIYVRCIFCNQLESGCRVQERHKVKVFGVIPDFIPVMVACTTVAGIFL
jgi:hypothetical protein